eukprot:2429-Heterococcus_DN1.PRE.5
MRVPHITAHTQVCTWLQAISLHCTSNGTLTANNYHWAALLHDMLHVHHNIRSSTALDSTYIKCACHAHASRYID